MRVNIIRWRIPCGGYWSVFHLYSISSALAGKKRLFHFYCFLDWIFIEFHTGMSFVFLFWNSTAQLFLTILELLAFNKRTLACPGIHCRPHLGQFFINLWVPKTGMFTKGSLLWLLVASQPAPHCASMSCAVLCEWSHSSLCPRRLRSGKEKNFCWDRLGHSSGSGSWYLPEIGYRSSSQKVTKVLEEKEEDQKIFPFKVKFHFNLFFQFRATKQFKLW